MTSHDFWMNVLAHFVAIVLGGVKLAILSGIFWYVFRKKYMAKFMGKLFQELMSQIQPPAPVPGYHSQPAVAPAAVPLPDAAFAAGHMPHGLLEDYEPLSLEELRPYIDELESVNPQTQAEILKIAAKHGYCWDSFGRLIRIPTPSVNTRPPVKICSGLGCTIGSEGLKHGPECPEAQKPN